MSFIMNEAEIEAAMSAAEVSEQSPLQSAVFTLFNLMEWTNRSSDGWAYWLKPLRASAKLQGLVHGATDWTGRPKAAISAADVKKAYSPIKAFLTKQGIDHDLIICKVD